MSKTVAFAVISVLFAAMPASASEAVPLMRDIHAFDESALADGRAMHQGRAGQTVPYADEHGAAVEAARAQQRHVRAPLR